MSENYALQLRHITKTFPGVKALNDVSFDVRYGTVHSIVGENGAGKSTLMKIINGINRCVLLCLFNESIHVRFARLKLCQTLFFLRNLFLQHTLLVCVIAGEHPVLLVCHAPKNIVL